MKWELSNINRLALAGVFQTVSDFAEITCTTPEKSLLKPLPKKAGRNNNGRITTRHQGGGNKRRYRVLDFKRNKDGIPAKVATVEYDPNRSARNRTFALCRWREALHPSSERPACRRYRHEWLGGRY